MTKAEIGSISHGTLRTADLLSAFADELERLGGDLELVSEARNVLPESEEALEIVSELEDALNELAPTYCYFGAHEGDGSDFGFWLCFPWFSEIEEGVHSGEILKLEAGSEIPAGTDDGQAVMFVTDHGNISVGHVRVRYEFIEDWSCV